MGATVEPATTRIRGGTLSGTDLGLAILLGGAAVIGGGVWWSGELAGLISGHGWLPVPLGQAFTIAVALAQHLGDPQLAWPVADRPDLPGAAVFYPVMAVVFTSIAALVVVAVRWWGTGREQRGMATVADLDPVLSARAVLAQAARMRPTLDRPARLEDVGVPLGAAGRRHLYAGLESSVLLVAAPRQGKTSQVIIPWVHHFPGPALVTSVRADVLQATAGLRPGTAWLLDLDTGLPWPHQLRWTPICGAEDFEVARRRADVMIQVGKPGTAGIDSSNAGFFGMTATNLLAAWLHTAALSGRTMLDVRQWAVDPTDDTPIRLARDADGMLPGVAKMLDGFYRQPESTRSNLWTTVQTGTSCLFGKAAAQVFGIPAAASFDIDAFLRSNGDTLYLVVDEKNAAALAPLLTAFLDDILAAALTLAKTSPNGRLDPPLGLLLDEVANVIPLPDLPQNMSYAAGFGIFITAVLTNLAGAQRRWQAVGRDELWKNATIKIALGGLAGDDLDAFSVLAGTHREALHVPQQHRGGYSIQTSIVDRKTVPPERIRTLSQRRREALVIHATTPPVITRMVRHYQSRHAAEYIAAAGHARQLMGLPPENTPDEHRLRRRLAARFTRRRSGADPGMAPDEPSRTERGLE